MLTARVYSSYLDYLHDVVCMSIFSYFQEPDPRRCIMFTVPVYEPTSPLTGACVYLRVEDFR
jgi:hypothetical protein